ncbi:MAG: 50S ribosomal protein L1 [Dehalococcoidia bacterium]|nr:50S ribosomal protein L1 [Dehalococcoidia bacterium]
MTTKTTAQSLEGRSKRYKAVAPGVERGKEYSPAEAVDLVKKTATAKFDETIEAHIRTNVDPQREGQGLRGVASLPHGVGKTVRVVAFVTGETANAARQAGADYVADDELINKIEKDNWTDFEVAVATPDMMGRIGRLGRVLGRKGLMPNPRTGTVVPPQDIPKVIQEAKKGRVEFRMDKTAVIHAPIGKKSFSNDKLVENFASLMDTVNKAKPAGVKGAFIRSVFMTSTMGPSVKLSVSQATEAKSE